ncbi:hypothetical protein [Sphingomonas sp. dw_22]|uniref:hypothetical protein n=1 Tax=Sphingomonas sp. dw_22 TaxID=2721175 RepID=UPI001BD5FDD3|nr:hypothetical protein [Sphingomonas sp. dw_22]
MIAALALVMALQNAPIDWESLAPLPYRAPPVVTGEMQAFVQREVAARKCPVAPAGGQSVTIDVAVLVDASDGIRTSIPRAIQCPTVEQYAAALVAGFARNNLLPRTTPSEQWYKTSLTFTWK